MVIVTNTILMTKLYDIHTHLIYDLDDGAKTIEDSIYLLKQAYSLGVKKIICTPRYYYDDLRFKRSKFHEHFNKLKIIADKLDIKIYKGSENLLTGDLINALNEKKAYTLANTNYVLVELKREENNDFNKILDLLEELFDYNYKVILAHPENCDILTIDRIKKLKAKDVLIQVDAISFNKKNKKRKKYVCKLIKNNLVDIVSSDVHSKKRNYEDLLEAGNYVYKKFGRKVFDRLFTINPLRVIEGEDIEK